MNASDAEARLAQIVPRLERARDEWDAPLGASYARQIWDRAISEVRAVLDAAPVAAAPPQGIGRDALVRPVGGGVLTPEEAQRVLEWYGTSLLRAPEDRALAARLEAAQ